MPAYTYTFTLDKLLTDEEMQDFAQGGAIFAGTLEPEIKLTRKKLHISGRRWFQRTWGNTYHSVKIYIDDELIDHMPYAYGYGDCYLQTAVDILKEKGYLPQDAQYGTYYLREESGYDFTYSVEDVQRKRDL